MKILITGSAGRMGKQIGLAMRDYQLVHINRGQYSPSSGMSYRVDLENPSGLEKIFRDEKPDAVIHLAAALAQACEKSPQLAKKVNVEATERLAHLASAFRVKKFIMASTSAVYHQTKLEPTKEADNIAPQSVYGKTKLDAEKKLRAEAAKSSTQFVCLRIFNVYGEEFVDSLVYQLLHSTSDKPALLYGPDNFYRDYVHVSYVVKAFSAALTADTGSYSVFNIASGRVLSNRQLLEELKASGSSPNVKIVEHGESISWADIKKAKQILDFHPGYKIVMD